MASDFIANWFEGRTTRTPKAWNSQRISRIPKLDIEYSTVSHADFGMQFVYMIMQMNVMIFLVEVPFSVQLKLRIEFSSIQNKFINRSNLND